MSTTPQPDSPATAPKIDDGGPAFPVLQLTTIHGEVAAAGATGGMTLRDYFAAHALQALVQSEGDNWLVEQAHLGRTTEVRCQSIAAASYRLADAMLAARKGGVA